MEYRWFTDMRLLSRVPVGLAVAIVIVRAMELSRMLLRRLFMVLWLSRVISLSLIVKRYIT